MPAVPAPARCRQDSLARVDRLASRLAAIRASRGSSPRAAIGRLVPRHVGHVVGKIALAGGVRVLLVVRVAIALAVAEVLHQLRRRVAQAQRHRARAVLGDERARRAVGRVDGVRLRRAGEIEHRLGERELALGRAEALVGLDGGERRATARADRRGRCPRSPSGSAAARRRAGRRRRRASGTSSTAPRRDRSRAPPCAARRSGRRTPRRPCRSGAGCARSSLRRTRRRSAPCGPRPPRSRDARPD